MKKILYEGIDCTGKSTKTNAIAEKENLVAISPGKEAENTKEYYDNIFKNNERVVLDRGFISEIVYAKQFKRKARISALAAASLILKHELEVSVFLVSNFSDNIRCQNARHLDLGTPVDLISQLKEDCIRFIYVVKEINSYIMDKNLKIKFFDVKYSSRVDNLRYVEEKDVNVFLKEATRKSQLKLNMKRKIMMYDLTGKLYTSGNIDFFESMSLCRKSIVEVLHGVKKSYCSMIFRYEYDLITKFKLPFEFGEPSENEKYITCTICDKKLSIRNFKAKNGKECRFCKETLRLSDLEEKKEEKIGLFKITNCNVCHNDFETECDELLVPYNKTCPRCKELAYKNTVTEKGMFKAGKMFTTQV